MNVSAIGAARALNITPPAGIGAAESTGTQSFTQVLANAAQSLSSLENQANSSAMALVSGQPIETHDVMLQMEEASVGLNMAMAMRNKVIEAYQDIMRTQV